MGKLNLAVVFGGCSPEHEISKISAATIISNIPEGKYNIIPVYITKDGRWLLYDGSADNIRNVRWEKHGTPALLSPDRSHRGLLRIVGDKVKLIPVDVVFPVLHGKNGEDGSIQGLLQLSGLPFVGSGVTASAAAMDKSIQKQIADALGIRQANYLFFKRNSFLLAENMKSFLQGESEATDPAGAANKDFYDEVCKKVRAKIKYPCFVKPAASGSSIGVSKVKNKSELLEAIDEAFKFDNKILIEKAVSGRELECAVIGSGGDDTEASTVGEIVPAAEFYDYESKYINKGTKVIVPAEIPDEVADEARITSIKLFKALGCSGLARVDFFYEESTGKLVLNEINTIPGFTSISMYPMLWNESGIDITDLIDRFVDIALIEGSVGIGLQVGI